MVARLAKLLPSKLWRPLTRPACIFPAHARPIFCPVMPLAVCMVLSLQGAANTPPFFHEFVAPPPPPPPAAAEAVVHIRARMHRRRQGSSRQQTAQRLPPGHGPTSGGLDPSGMEAVTQRVTAAVAAVLGAPVAARQPLMEAGLDSLGEYLKHRFANYAKRAGSL